MIEGIFADKDSEFEDSESETEESDSGQTEEESGTQERNETAVEENVATEPPTRGSNRGRMRGRGVRTRGGIRNNQPRLDAKSVAKANKESALETKWKNEDHPPNIPDFTGESKINVDLPEEPTEIDFLDLFLDDEFFTMLTTQTHLYAVQYREIHQILPRYSRAANWKPVTNEEMREFLALYLLTGIVRKPELSQYWSTDPLLKRAIFNEVMPRNRFQSIDLSRDY